MMGTIVHPKSVVINGERPSHVGPPSTSWRRKFSWAFLAGLIEGKGYIFLQRSRHFQQGAAHYWFGIYMRQNRLGNLGGLQEKCGGHLRKNKRGHWDWHVTGQCAYDLLLHLRSHLTEKLREAELGIRFWEHFGRTKSHGRHPQGKGTCASCEAMVQTMKTYHLPAEKTPAVATTESTEAARLCDSLTLPDEKRQEVETPA